MYKASSKSLLKGQSSNCLFLCIRTIGLDSTLRVAINGNNEAIAFHLGKIRMRRIGPEVVTYLDFTDDIVLLSEDTYQAQDLLIMVEASVG